MKNVLVCWKCGAPLNDVPLPFSRRAECPACHAELHVCRSCRYYDPRVNGQCTEDRAEEVREKARANFCDYFKPRPDAYVRPEHAKTQAAKAKVDALFGTAAAESDVRSKEEAARDRLDRLLGASDKKNR